MSVIEIDLSPADPDAPDDNVFRVKIAAAINALGGKSRLAEYLGVARSQPGKWLAGAERPNPQARRLIMDLDYVWNRLTDEQAPAAARIWLDSPNGFLDRATPLAWLLRWGPSDLIGAFNAHEAGSYA